MSSPEVIDYRRLLYAIAKHLYPDPVDIPGLPGVKGKRLFNPDIGLGTAPTALTQEEQALLAALVAEHPADLPALRSVMEEPEATAFLTAYRTLDGRPDWEPVLRSPHDAIQLRSRRMDAQIRHDGALKLAVSQGLMRHFDEERVPVFPHGMYVSYVPREDAHAYLRHINLDPHMVLGDSSSNDEARPTLEAAPSRRRHWSATDRQRVMESVRAGQPEVAATEFGITRQYVKQLATRFEQEAEAKRPHQPDEPSAPPASMARSPMATSSDTPTTSEGGAPPHAMSTISEQVRPTADPPRSAKPRTSHPSHAPVISVAPTARLVILRMPDVQQRVGLSNRSIYARLNPKSKYYDPTFPKQVLLSGKTVPEDASNKGAVGFIAEEIDKWIESRGVR
jgi:prophage regulatory protein